jgi:DNA-binding MarR family transcriptional regulator
MPLKSLDDEAAGKVAHTLHLVNASFIRLEDNLHRKIGVTPQQFGVLSVLKSAPPPVTPKDVSEQLDRKSNSITLIVDRMEKGGLICRVRDLNDRRSLRLQITKKGEEAFKVGSDPHHKLYREIMSCLNREEQQALLQTLDKILARTLEMRRSKTKKRERKTSPLLRGKPAGSPKPPG